MAYEIDGFLRQCIQGCKARLPVSLAMTGTLPFDAWRAQLRAGITGMLGAFPAPAPLALQTIEEKQLPGVSRRFITYQSQEGLTVPAWYLVPDAPLPGKPGVVAIHGHGFGVDDIVGIREDGRDYAEGEDPGYHKSFALALARRGFHVISPELLGFGRLRTARDKAAGNAHASSCHAVTTTLLMCGSSIAAARVFQCVRALDVLEALGDADPTRLGCMGISGGGLVSTFLAALEDRIKDCVVSGYANTFEASVLGVPMHCVDNFFFGALQLAEMPDILASIAPRPMLWEMGDQDDIFPIEAGRGAAELVSTVYRKLGAADVFAVDEFTGTHQISGAQSYDFLAKHL